MIKTPFLTFCFLNATLSLSAQTLISDNFNTANTSDLNADLGRQTGSLAPLNWTEIGPVSSNQTQIISNQLSVGGSSTSQDYSAELAFDFGTSAALTQDGGFTVSFDLLSLASGSYTAFAMTGDPDRLRPAVDASTEFGLLFRESDNDISIREGTGSLGSVSVPAASQLGAVVLTVTTDDITTGENFTVGMTIAGNTIDLNGASAGTDFNGTWDSGDLYFSWGSRNGTSVIDNVQIAAIPEPGVYALALGGITLLWAFRRRQASA